RRRAMAADPARSRVPGDHGDTRLLVPSDRSLPRRRGRPEGVEGMARRWHPHGPDPARLRHRHRLLLRRRPPEQSERPRLTPFAYGTAKPPFGGLRGRPRTPSGCAVTYVDATRSQSMAESSDRRDL